jgi:glutamyl-tRNA(Gln) amidotransferase subunit E
VANSTKFIDLKVGFEVHQQLATKGKLFCNCRWIENETYRNSFIRKLRPTQSELGTYDNAALFEFRKMRTIKYFAGENSSCLVEADEEPPHEIDNDALETVLILALALHSKVVDEIHVMRKIVIDGSNTTGFQRTMLIATGGYIEVDNERVGVQSICLEEDAAKLISDNGLIKEYGLNRLGVPLVEITLEPVTHKPKELMLIALNVGMLLRRSKRVTRGLGSIRQDVNISLDNGGIVEVKGVQKLDQLVKVIEFETIRQQGLSLIAQKLKDEIKIPKSGVGDKVEDVTDILKGSSSKIVKRSLAQRDCVFKAIRIRNFHGILGYEPHGSVRLGKELGELVRFYGLGGVFHSDELPKYGISVDEVDKVIRRLELIASTDAFVIVGGPKDQVKFAIDAIIQRLKMAVDGAPSETRAATLDGKTVFSRPRPGASRMYPETDISSIPISNSILDSLHDKVVRMSEDTVTTLVDKYGLNKKLAQQVFDSNYFELFEKIANSTKIEPTFIASKLTEDLVRLGRLGFEIELLTDDLIEEVFNRLDTNILAKESITLIFEKIVKREAKTVDEAVSVLGINPITEDEVQKIIDNIISENLPLISEKGIGSQGLLMGRSMAALRGKVEGQKVNSLLKKKLEQLLDTTRQ